MGVQVALDAERRDEAFGDGALGQPARRDVDLDDGALHSVNVASRPGQMS